MAIDPITVARKLKQARKLQYLTLSKVSSATGISYKRINLIESEQVNASGDELLILANYYRHDFRDFIDKTRPEPFKQTKILYRRYRDTFTPDDRRAVQEFLYLCEIESTLEISKGILKKPFNFVPKGSFHKKHGEIAALELRKHLGHSSNEIPRNVFSDFRKIGIHIFRRRLVNSDISGLYIEHPVAGHCVLINYHEDLYRQRFSVSHETAHVIFDSSQAVTVTFKSTSPRYNKKDLQEIRANKFASCYLMPPSCLPQLSHWNPTEAIEWAQRLRVSTMALSIALREAGLVDETTAKMIRSFKVEFEGKIDAEVSDKLTQLQQIRRVFLLDRGLSDYYVELCFDAYQDGIISTGRLSEALLTDDEKVREISVLYGRSI